MAQQITLQRYMKALLAGDRKDCRVVIEESLKTGIPANRVYMDILWPVMVEIDNLWRGDKINSAQESMATRINRTLVDQLQNKLPRRETRNKRIVVCSGPQESGELGAQMTADLFESDGWEVRFLGGGTCNDDILTFVHEYQPEILLIYGATPKCAPNVRQLIDTVRSINAWPDMKIMLSGGVFNRAEGLWDEIGADLFAATAAEAVVIASRDTAEQLAVHEPKTINIRKKTLHKQPTTKSYVAKAPSRKLVAAGN
ncbi:MAG: B12-binding domain-containing protein [Sedimentisphaerales bacterium]|nr:B12-binding domain-containing protein [Sedimentisphaerales bacterium]